MKVLFIAPQLNAFLFSPPLPSGLLSIASYVEANSSHDVKIFDRNINSTSIKKIIAEYNPDIVGISLVSSMGLHDARKISKICKALNKTVVWGGQFATSCAHLIIKEDFVDIVSLGVGEKNWLTLMNTLENNYVCLDDIPGIVYKKNGKIIRNEEDLNDCSFSSVKCNYNLIDVPSYFSEYFDGLAKNMLWVFAKKGCYGQCTFCCNKAFNHRRMYKRPFKYVCEEIKFLCSQYGADAFYFGDELWCVSSEEMKELCDMLAEIDEKFVWGCQMRVDVLEPEDYKYMYDHGCRWIFFGIETGDAQRMKKIKKCIPVEAFYPAIKACYDSGILPTASFILGYPNETVEELKTTAKLIYDLSFISDLNMYYYAPFMGSEMYEDMVRDKLIPEVKSVDDLIGGFYTKPNAKLLSKYSDIPFIDLCVILNCAIMWNTFNRNKNISAEERRNGTVNTERKRNVIKETFKKLFGFFGYMVEYHGTGDLRLCFAMMTKFIGKFAKAFFFSTMFPRIRKKYGLKLFSRKDENT